MNTHMLFILSSTPILTDFKGYFNSLSIKWGKVGGCGKGDRISLFKYLQRTLLYWGSFLLFYVYAFISYTSLIYQDFDYSLLWFSFMTSSPIYRHSSLHRCWISFHISFLFIGFSSTIRDWNRGVISSSTFCNPFSNRGCGFILLAQCWIIYIKKGSYQTPYWFIVLILFITYLLFIFFIIYCINYIIICISIIFRLWFLFAYQYIPIQVSFLPHTH